MMERKARAVRKRWDEQECGLIVNHPSSRRQVSQQMGLAARRLNEELLLGSKRAVRRLVDVLNRRTRPILEGDRTKMMELTTTSVKVQLE